jgi:hypothetical protein
MGWAYLPVFVAALAGSIAQSPAPSQAVELPPPYPRPGTTKILDNDVVAVWVVGWLKQKYPLHTHRYDLVGMSYAEGDRIITQGDAPGRLTSGKVGGGACTNSRRCSFRTDAGRWTRFHPEEFRGTFWAH